MYVYILNIMLETYFYFVMYSKLVNSLDFLFSSNTHVSTDNQTSKE